jgi:hypothetical protein
MTRYKKGQEMKKPKGINQHSMKKRRVLKSPAHAQNPGEVEKQKGKKFANDGALSPEV